MPSDIEPFGQPEPTTQLEPPPSPGTALAPLMDMGPAEIERTVEQTRMAAEAMKRITTAAMARLFPKDFIDFGGKPYLQGSGARRLCDVGISLGEPIFSIETLGNDILVECMVEAVWRRMLRSDWGLGTCDTRDKFFVGTDDNPKAVYGQMLTKAGGNETLARRMLRGHVKKKAYENAVSRAVSAVMGIKGLSWDDLATLGFTPEKAGARVAFDGGKIKPARQTTMEDISPVSVAELERVSIGETVALLGVTMRAGRKLAKFVLYTVADDLEHGDSIDVMIWTTNPPPDFAKHGARVSFPQVKVGEYRGNRQYVATAIKEVVTQ